MKNLLLFVSFALAFIISPLFAAQSQNELSKNGQGESKVKVKAGQTIVRDKSKPV